MNEEPKNRSRAWIIWALVAVFVLYPLSVGPASLMYWRVLKGTSADKPFHAACGIVYWPLDWLTRRNASLMDLATKYDHWWAGN
jgi:hypothetical protein